MTDNFHLYTDVVHETISRVNYIWTPAIPGAKKNVVLAREPNGITYVFKFSNQQYAIRNSNVARALRDADIPAPEIVAQNYEGHWFEMYPAIEGQTLYETVGDGISRIELTRIYTNLLKLFEKMSQIDFSNVDFCGLPHAHQIAREDTTKTNNALLGNLTGAAVRVMNMGRHADMGLYHHGMTPKNIMITNRCDISGILDIDEAGICNINYAVGVMLAKAKIIGLDVNALCKKFEHETGQRINRSHISAIIGIQNLGRNILYRTKSK